MSRFIQKWIGFVLISLISIIFAVALVVHGLGLSNELRRICLLIWGLMWIIATFISLLQTQSENASWQNALWNLEMAARGADSLKHLDDYLSGVPPHINSSIASLRSAVYSLLSYLPEGHMPSAPSRSIHIKVDQSIVASPSETNINHSKEVALLYIVIPDFTGNNSKFVDVAIPMVFRYGGIIEELAPNYIVATWNSKTYEEDYCLKACSCAIELDELFSKFSISAMMSINSGTIIVGVVGLTERRSTFISGTIVDRGPIIAKLNSELCTRIVVTESVHGMIRLKVWSRLVDVLDWGKGSEDGCGQESNLYEILGWEKQGSKWPGHLNYEKAFASYRKGKYNEAAAYFQQTLNECPREFSACPSRLLYICQSLGQNGDASPIPYKRTLRLSPWLQYGQPSTPTTTIKTGKPAIPLSKTTSGTYQPLYIVPPSPMAVESNLGDDPSMDEDDILSSNNYSVTPNMCHTPPQVLNHSSNFQQDDMDRCLTALTLFTRKTKNYNIRKIVLTGGPCAGKSSALSSLACRLTSQGIEVFTVPEAATILISAGMKFDSMTTAKTRAFQTTLLETQMHLEDAVMNIAKMCTGGNRPALVVCDRGTMDGRAYCSQADWEAVCKSTEMDLGKLRDNRYDAVFHMVTAADGAEKFYTLETNAARTETAEEAKALDTKLKHAYLGHPHITVVDNSTNFDEKVSRVVSGIAQLFGLQLNTGSMSYRYLVVKSCPDILPIPSETLQVDVLLLRNSSQGRERRVCKRGKARQWLFLHQREERRVDGPPLLVEHRLTGKEYSTLVSQADPRYPPLTYSLRSFMHHNQLFELRTFQTPLPWEGRTFLYFENSGDQDWKSLVPSFVEVEKDVTNEPGYSFYEIAATSVPLDAITSLSTFRKTWKS